MSAWILVGMMGSGKSTVGKALAEATGRAFIDTDMLLQNRFGRPVAQVFGIYGEETFRAHETSVLKGIEPGRAVVSTGGGIVTRPENWIEMRRLGVVAYLHADWETLADRLEASKRKRPLLDRPDWKDELRRLIQVREPLYRQADLVVEVDQRDIELAADRIREKFEAWEATH
jgi:hypothetical protein